ncbi:MBL fold metallo-hydrolase [Leifsonia sp. F6_8S_P_1B]|uniref:MBL fold metallo-hydrolase n=1 Tax=Leifsonia williamsii TaxID=3035919 RepID=A0ABT8K660_9MICO|nr:MBL fold metallo-hydrolase [Leifsonia williamsii]MDN4612889.1 MBL fold metallo-hydrolase [Leifsonia williamsii]
MRRLRSFTIVAPGIAFAEGPAANWVVFTGRDAVELVDAGYPADRALVEASIRWAGGDVSQLRRILLTHGHSDHLGASRELAARTGATVETMPEELGNVRRDITEQVTVADLLPSIAKRGTVRWAVSAIRAGGLGEVGVPDAAALTGDDVELSTGHRLRVIATPGHTSGHTAFFEPEAGALISGDALVTGHPLLRDSGRPQPLPAFFHHDREEAARSAAALDLTGVRLLLPGHGPLLRL